MAGKLSYSNKSGLVRPNRPKSGLKVESALRRAYLLSINLFSSPLTTTAWCVSTRSIESMELTDVDTNSVTSAGVIL